MSLFCRFGQRRKPRLPSFTAPLAPDEDLYVIGDIHGRDDLMEKLLGKISRHKAGHPALTICVGDLVDRGEQSAAVLTRLFELAQSGVLVCIMGNHERMMLDFMDNPGANGPRWLACGGLQTLASFAIGGVSVGSTGPELHRARDQLRTALPNGVEDWLRQLPLSLQSGNVLIVHAAADPSLPLLLQTRNTLLWGHSDFQKHPRSDGQWVVHGHVVTKLPYSQNGRINVDTGAWHTGRLTAAVISRDRLDFIST